MPVQPQPVCQHMYLLLTLYTKIKLNGHENEKVVPHSRLSKMKRQILTTC